MSGLTNGTVYRIVSGGPTAVSVTDVTVTEGDSGTVSATFSLSLSAAVAQTVSVQYATAEGTAVAGDYVPASGTVTSSRILRGP